MWLLVLAPIVTVGSCYWTLVEMQKTYNSSPAMPAILAALAFAASVIAPALIIVGRDFYGEAADADDADGIPKASKSEGGYVGLN